VLVGCSVGVETLLRCSERGRFVKAQDVPSKSLKIQCLAVLPSSAILVDSSVVKQRSELMCLTLVKILHYTYGERKILFLKYTVSQSTVDTSSRPKKSIK
jgi:hypothetical protein